MMASLCGFQGYQLYDHGGHGAHQHGHSPWQDPHRRAQRAVSRGVNSLYTVIMSFNKVFIVAVKGIGYDRYDDGLASVDSNGISYTTIKVMMHINMATRLGKTLTDARKERSVVVLAS